jgi:hypothetical protein
MGGVYVPLSPTTGALYGVVRGHWSDFVARVKCPERLPGPSRRRRFGAASAWDRPPFMLDVSWRYVFVQPKRSRAAARR